MKAETKQSLTRAIGHAAVLAVCLIALACGAARRREPLATPVALDQRAERGRAVFMANCHQCHPGGEAGLGPALNDKPFPEFLKKFQVRHGLGTMPSFSEQKISNEQLDDLMAYLDALRRARSTRKEGYGHQSSRSLQ
jgi:mono/diheme cytochrome c family protein